MKIIVNRTEEYNGSTISNISIDGEYVCHGLEDGFNDPKIAGETRIPEGIYEIKLRDFGGFHSRYSEAVWVKDIHKGMLEISDVPGFTDVLIHTGNTKNDTRGCLLLGRSYFKKEDGFFLSQSRKAYLDVYPKIVDRLINEEEVLIELIDPEN